MTDFLPVLVHDTCKRQRTCESFLRVVNYLRDFVIYHVPGSTGVIEAVS